MILNIRFSIFLLFLLNIGFKEVGGQNNTDKLYLFYDVSPSSNFKKISGKINQADLFELSLGCPPINLTPRLKWIHSVYGKAMSIQFEGLENNYANLTSKFYDIQYGQAFIYSLRNTKWSLFAAPRIIIRSDFKKNQPEHGVFPSGIFLANYNPDGKKQLTWSFGIAFANDFNRNQIIPIAGFSYKSHKYFVEVAYPRINALYKPSDKIEWGITGAVTGGIFKVVDTKLSNEEISPYTRIINVSVGHTFNYKLNDRLVLNTCVGYLPVRNYDLLNSNYKPLKSNDTDLKPTAFFRTGLSVRF